MQKDSVLNELSERELEILEMLSHGFDIDYISEILKISVLTVKSHIQHIYMKLQIYDETVKYQAGKRIRAVLIYLKETGRLNKDWIIDV